MHSLKELSIQGCPYTHKMQILLLPNISNAHMAGQNACALRRHCKLCKKSHSNQARNSLSHIVAPTGGDVSTKGLTSFSWH